MDLYIYIYMDWYMDYMVNILESWYDYFIFSLQPPIIYDCEFIIGMYPCIDILIIVHGLLAVGQFAVKKMLISVRLG